MSVWGSVGVALAGDCPECCEPCTIECDCFWPSPRTPPKCCACLRYEVASPPVSPGTYPLLSQTRCVAPCDTIFPPPCGPGDDPNSPANNTARSQCEGCNPHTEAGGYFAGYPTGYVITETSPGSGVLSCGPAGGFDIYCFKINPITGVPIPPGVGRIWGMRSAFAGEGANPASYPERVVLPTGTVDPVDLTFDSPNLLGPQYDGSVPPIPGTIRLVEDGGCNCNAPTHGDLCGQSLPPPPPAVMAEAGSSPSAAKTPARGRCRHLGDDIGAFATSRRGLPTVRRWHPCGKGHSEPGYPAAAGTGLVCGCRVCKTCPDWEPTEGDP